MNLDERREVERAKYERLRSDPRYGGTNHGLDAINRVLAEGPKCVVDLGCGRNDFCRSLQAMGIRALGVDFAFEEADLRAPMHAVPLPDASADVVTAFDSFEHLLPDEVGAVLAEAKRVAKPGGLLVASICHRESRFEPGLHPTVRPRHWWLERIAAVAELVESGRYVVAKFHGGSRTAAVLNPADRAAIERGTASAIEPRSGMRFWTADWSPVSLRNWLRGRHLFIVCSGPSLKTLDLSLLSKRGIITLGVNNSWLVHRPTFWTCVDHPNRFADVCWKDPGIVKFVPAEHRDARLRVLRPDGTDRQSQFAVHEMPSVWLYQRADAFDHRTFATAEAVQWGCPGKVYDSIGINGKRSVMQAALSLACHLGAGQIYLLGADFRMAPDARYAFDEARTDEAIRHNNVLYAALDRRFKALHPELKTLGVRVWNCTEGSGLTAFPHLPYEQAVERAAAEAGQTVPSEGWYEPNRAVRVASRRQ